MKNTFLLILFFTFGLSVQSCAQTQNVIEAESHTAQKNKPHIIILATGGTIAGSGESQTKAAYTAGEVPVEELLNAVPEIQEKAKISGEQIANIGSQDMNLKTWLKLSNRINEIFENDEADGVVITHGTDTMEETAYFLSLTISSDKPVVLVGAMRPSTALSQDGNRNLLDAVTVASSPKSRGVVVAMNEYIFSARDVEKTSTTNISAFYSRNFGPIGMVFDNMVNYYHRNIRQQNLKFNVSKLNDLPRIDIIYGYADANSNLIDFSVKDDAAGIVYAGVGNGNFNQSTEASLAKAVQDGVMVVRSSRISKGRVTLENEVDDEKLGFIVSDDLNPQKARILLMLALTITKDRDEIQKMFFGE